MGKKLKGAALRAKKRANQAVEELQEWQAEQVAQQSLAHASDDQLFVLDTVGDHEAAVKLQKKNAQQEKRKGLSEKEEKQVKKLIKTHGADKLQELAKAGRDKLQRRALGHMEQHDIWAGETDVRAPKTTVVKPGIGSSLAGTAPSHVQAKAKPLQSKPQARGIAVDVAKAGQSYHPDPVAHSALLKEAVEVELKRKEVEKIQKTPISTGLSETTRALLVGDSDSEDSDAEQEEGETVRGTIKLRKRTEKLTKAQRNKQKRVREEKTQQKLNKRQKVLMKQIGDLPRLSKEVKKKEREREEMEKTLAEQREKHVQTLGKDLDMKLFQDDPIKAPAIPVPLSDELKSTLRAIKPKGNLSRDRIMSMADRNLTAKRVRKEGKKHAGSNKKRRLKVIDRKGTLVKGEEYGIKG